jgi:hypothetical protein
MIDFLFSFFIVYGYDDYHQLRVLIIIFGSMHITGMLMRVNLGFYAEGSIITDRKEIILNYSRKFFLEDIMALVSLFFVFIFMESNSLFVWCRVVALGVFLKNKTLLNNLEKVEENLNTDKYQNIWTLWKLFLSAFFLCHIVGTLYFLVGLCEIHLIGNEKNWI